MVLIPYVPKSTPPTSAPAALESGNDSPGALRQSGLKATWPRMQVLRLFQQAAADAPRHLHADEVHRALLLQGFEIGLATIYRVLGQLEQAGLLRRSRFEGERAVFELNDQKHHDHIVCVRCGKVVEFCDQLIEERQREIAAERGFELVEHTLSLFGRCQGPDCRPR